MEQNAYQSLIGGPPVSLGLIGQNKQVLRLLPPSCDFPTAPRKECKAGMSQAEQNVHVFIDFNPKALKRACVCVCMCVILLKAGGNRVAVKLQSFEKYPLHRQICPWTFTHIKKVYLNS